MLEVNVCVGSSCHLKGSYSVVQILRKLIEEKSLGQEVGLKAQFCMQRCQQGVAAFFENEAYSLSPENAQDFFENTVIKAISKGGAELLQQGDKASA